jgi:hypothetical protein
VTGVQTCALPISWAQPLAAKESKRKEPMTNKSSLFIITPSYRELTLQKQVCFAYCLLA